MEGEYTATFSTWNCWIDLIKGSVLSRHQVWLRNTRYRLKGPQTSLSTWEVEFFWSPRCYYMMELLSNKYFILFRVTILRIQILCSFFAHEQLFTNNYLPVASHIKKNFGYSVRNNSCQKSTIFFFLSIKTKSTEVSSNEGTKRGPVGSLYQFLLTRTYRQLLRGLQVFNNKNINISLWIEVFSAFQGKYLYQTDTFRGSAYRLGYLNKINQSMSDVMMNRDKVTLNRIIEDTGGSQR